MEAMRLAVVSAIIDDDKLVALVIAEANHATIRVELHSPPLIGRTAEEAAYEIALWYLDIA